MFSLDYFLSSLPKIISGLPLTIYISFMSVVLGSFFGMILAYFRIKNVPVLGLVSRIITSFSRSVPLIVSLYVFYYALPNIFPELFPKEVPQNLVAILTFAIFAGGYMAETFRAGYEAVPKGQIEAAFSCGLTKFQTLYSIIIPQAVCSCLPNFTSTSIDVIKGTAIVYNISIFEIMGMANLIGSKGYRYAEAYAGAWLIYLMLAFILYITLTGLEKSISQKYGLTKRSRS